MAGIIEVARIADVTETQARAVCAAIREVADAGEKVIIKGFGTFQYKLRAARAARNPGTGETIAVPAKMALTFKAAKK